MTIFPFLIYRYIFFAHSMDDYFTVYETEMLKKLEEWYPRRDGYEIINPRDILTGKGLSKEEIKKLSFWEIEHTYFFPEILKCELVIVAKSWTNPAWRGKFTPGVLAEIRYAQDNEKKILEFCE